MIYPEVKPFLEPGGLERAEKKLEKAKDYERGRECSERHLAREQKALESSEKKLPEALSTQAAANFDGPMSEQEAAAAGYTAGEIDNQIQAGKTEVQRLKERVDMFDALSREAYGEYYRDPEIIIRSFSGIM